MLELKSNLELPESEYHSEAYADCLSGSELWAYYDDCPAEYVYGERKETKSLITGSAVHSEVLEMQSFDELYYRGFEPVEGAYTSDDSIKKRLSAVGRTGYSTKKGMDLYDMLLEVEPDAIIAKVEIEKLALENEGKTCLSYKDYDMAKAMRKQLMQYDKYSELVNGNQCESSIFGHSKIFGAKVKVRPDILVSDTATIYNYKTSTSAKPSKVIKDCFNWGYLMKEVFNHIVTLEYFGAIESIEQYESFIQHDEDALDAVFSIGESKLGVLVQSKKTPYVCSCLHFTNAQVLIGLEQLKSAIGLWKACKDAGAAIDYCQGEIVTARTPRYMLNL